jgi:hypothetical protein
MAFVETSVIILIVINSIQLITKFLDKLNSSSCTGKNHKVEINMKGNDKIIERYIHSSDEEN